MMGNTKTIRMGTGVKKYDPIWRNLKDKGFCRISCTNEDILTITNGVKKHKAQDKHKPNGKKLAIRVVPTDDPSKVNIEFRLVTDTSINNL